MRNDKTSQFQPKAKQTAVPQPAGKKPAPTPLGTEDLKHVGGGFGRPGGPHNGW